MLRIIPSTAANIYSNFVNNAIAKASISEDRHLSRKRALETLDLALLEYMSFSMPSGFKDWEPNVESIKKLEPHQKMIGFLSFTNRGGEVVKSRNRFGVIRDDDEDLDDEERCTWSSTNLLRLARLGIVTPMVSSSGLQRHNMRCVYAGLVDGFVLPTHSTDDFAVCSFSLPDWRQVLAEDYRKDLHMLISKHNMLLQDMCYDKTAPEFSSLENRLAALQTFLRGSLSWMLLDLPIGGSSPNNGVSKFAYAFSNQIRRAMTHVEHLIGGDAAAIEWKKHGHSSWYGSVEITSAKTIVPQAYSGLHGHLERIPGKLSLTCPHADLRRAVLMALLYPGLLADHGIVSAYVMAKSRESKGAGVTDVKEINIRTVDRSLQETIWMNEVTMNVNPLLTPNPVFGTMEVVNPRRCDVKQIPLDLMTPKDLDHQDIVDQSFGTGYVRMSTSKRIGSLVKEAIREVIRGGNGSLDGLIATYSKYRDALNAVSPLIAYKPAQPDLVQIAFGMAEEMGAPKPVPAADNSSTELELKHEDLTVSQ